MATQTTKRTLKERIVYAEMMAACSLGNYNEVLEAGRTKSAEKLLAKSQYWRDLLGWGA